MKKIIFGILATCICENGKYLASIMGDSVIMCDEFIEKTILINFNERKAAFKAQNFFILLAFLLITTTLLIDFSINCYMIKYRSKQKHLLPFHDTNNELKQKHYNFIAQINELKQVLY